jgi:hypothetical protein
LDVIEQRLFEEPADWREFVPDQLESFTARDMAETMGIRMRLAQRMAYCLRKAGVIEVAGRSGRAYLYRAAGT